MATIGTKTKEKLDELKRKVESSYKYFQNNYKRYREFRNFAFRETVSEKQRSLLNQLNRPVVEYNIVEAPISRLLGEFSKHEPGIIVSPAEGVPVQQQVLDLVEGHLRHIMHEADKNSFSYEVYKDLLSGGFSVAKVYTDYASPMSFNQMIYHKRVFDPTLCGFDPLARASHKGDGHYCFEIYPYLLEDFERMYPNVETRNLSFLRNIEGYTWSYEDSDFQKIVLCADYFEKKVKKVKIVKLANGRVLTEKNYEKLEAYWSKEQVFTQIPKVIGKPRVTDITSIINYKFLEDQMIERTETDYTYLPLVFFDGNSINLVKGTSNNTYQMTRPYIYNAKGIQEMVNFAGQTICNSMENLVQHKFIVMKEAIPQEKDYLEALTNIQRANTIVVNAYSENDPTKAIPTPIREVMNVPLPPEVTATFQGSTPILQEILGSFASNLGKNDNDLSGKAVIESTTVGNAAAMPYIVGYLAGLTQVENIEVDLMPKYIVGERTIGVVDKAGKRSYAEVNNGKIDINYDERAIKVNVEAGVNFQVQKNEAMQQILGLMQASEEFAAFMNDDGSLPILLDNLQIYGADRLQEAAEQWVQKKGQMQQQAQEQQQQAMMQDPRMIKAQAEMQKVQLQAQQNQIENQLDMAKLQIEKELAMSKILEAEAKVTQAQIDSSIKLTEQETSNFNHEIDAATKLAEIKSREHDTHRDNVKAAHGMHIAERDMVMKERGKDKNAHTSD